MPHSLNDETMIVNTDDDSALSNISSEKRYKLMYNLPLLCIYISGMSSKTLNSKVGGANCKPTNNEEIQYVQTIF